MIKLRVEWHHRCSGCGTRLILDFLDDSGDCRSCPWCGHAETCDPRGGQNGLKEYLQQAARELEQTANGRIAVKG